MNIFIQKKKWIQSSSRNEETLKFEISTIDIFLQRQDGQVSNEDPGNEGRRILRGGPDGLHLSILCNWYTVPLMEDSLAGCLEDRGPLFPQRSFFFLKPNIRDLNFF